MVKDEIKIKDENSEMFDKKQIDLVIRNSTLDDEINCSLLEEWILKECQGCSLNDICNGIDKVVNEYVNSNTRVVSSFSFE